MSTATQQYEAMLIALAEHDPSETRRAYALETETNIKKLRARRKNWRMAGFLSLIPLWGVVITIFVTNEAGALIWASTLTACGAMGFFALGDQAAGRIDTAKSDLRDLTRELDPREVDELTAALDRIEDLRPVVARWMAQGSLTIQELLLVRRAAQLQVGAAAHSRLEAVAGAMTAPISA